MSCDRCPVPASRYIYEQLPDSAKLEYAATELEDGLTVDCPFAENGCGALYVIAINARAKAFGDQGPPLELEKLQILERNRRSWVRRHWPKGW